MQASIRNLIKFKRKHPPFARAINTFFIENMDGNLKKTYDWALCRIDSITLSVMLRVSHEQASILLKRLFDMGLVHRKAERASYGIKYMYWRAEH